jgi:hypothetical protein
MGILDDLRSRREAHEKRLAKEAARQRRLEKVYITDFLPRLQCLYRYLSELIDNLNTLEIQTEVDFQLGSFGCIDGYRQRDYTLHVDSEDRMSEIRLTCRCERESPAKLSVATRIERDDLRELLTSHGVDFDDRVNYDRHREASSYLFEITPRLNAALYVRVDLDSLDTKCSFFNLGNLGLRDLVVHPRDLDDDFLDRLGRYLLGEDAELFYLNMSDEQRRALKAASKRAARERKLTEVLARQYSPNAEDCVAEASAISRLLRKLLTPR